MKHSLCHSARRDRPLGIRQNPVQEPFPSRVEEEEEEKRGGRHLAKDALKMDDIPRGCAQECQLGKPNIVLVTYASEGRGGARRSQPQCGSH